MSRLLARLSGRPVDMVDDLRRLLSIRLGDAPARPDLGLPVLPAWLPGSEARRQVQEAIAHALRSGEPRLLDVRISQSGDDEAPGFIVRAHLADGTPLGATARLAAGGHLGITP